MSLDYKLGISRISKKTVVFDLFLGTDTHEGYVKSLAPHDHYVPLTFQKEHLYADVDKAETKVVVTKELWKDLPVKEVILHLSSSFLEDRISLEHVLSNLVRMILANVYKDTTAIVVTHEGKNLYASVKDILSMIRKIQAARLMSMLPANEATPERIASRIQKFFKKVPHVTTKIFKQGYLKKHGFNLLRAVGAGAMNPPCMLVVERILSPKYPTVCVIGKGITFDTGGLSIKNYRSIIKMKFDKIGAVNASMALLHLMESKDMNQINLVGVFPFAENAVSETAVHPGDVVKSYLGKTVEIIDPDAEGRLVLADALAYAHKYHPEFVIDIATLTGHAEKINCWHYGYYFATPDALKEEFEDLTNEVGERMIPMPTWNDYSDVLKSSVADLINSPAKCSDAYVAALFLKEFVPEKSEWIHIDVTHEFDGNVPKGNGIRSIIAIVKQRFQKKK